MEGTRHPVEFSFRSNDLLGCPDDLADLVAQQDYLMVRVVEQLNISQGLQMINSFAHQSNVYNIKKCFEERICEISSWRWVLQDLAKRLDSAIDALNHEQDAFKVIIDRLEGEARCFSEEATRPGALCPNSDAVEEAVFQEYNFLRKEKKKFEKIATELEKRTAITKRTKRIIENDIQSKIKSLEIDEKCLHFHEVDLSEVKKKRKKRVAPLEKWERRCKSLKTSGLQALSNAVAIRQEVRAARVKLTITAQACTAKVDAALRRRLHINTIKLQDLTWQKEEAQRDYELLSEELASTKLSLESNMEQTKLVEAKLADRTLKPAGEMTRDQVDRLLKDELARLKLFMKGLKDNISRILNLQKNLTASILRIENASEDLDQVIRLDTMRINCRYIGQQPNEPEERTNVADQVPANEEREESSCPIPTLPTIMEEDEEDDYPFDF